MPNRDSKKHELARAWLQSTNCLANIWANKDRSASGYIYIGVILTEAFYSPNRWVSPQYIFSTIGAFSIDTIRRRLEEMVDLGMVEVSEIDTKKVYRATIEAAEATIQAYQAVRNDQAICV